MFFNFLQCREWGQNEMVIINVQWGSAYQMCAALKWPEHGQFPWIKILNGFRNQEKKRFWNVYDKMAAIIFQLSKMGY